MGYYVIQQIKGMRSSRKGQKICYYLYNIISVQNRLQK
jgi:hypothetical protein